MKGVQCDELFGGIALKNHAFFIHSFYTNIARLWLCTTACCVKMYKPENDEKNSVYKQNMLNTFRHAITKETDFATIIIHSELFEGKKLLC